MDETNSNENCESTLGCLFPFIGIIMTPLAAMAAVASAGAGHGHYVAARLCFPAPMLLTKLTGDTITDGLILLCLLQFPIYGAILGYGKKRLAVAIGLLAYHLVMTMLAMTSLPNFN